MSRYTTAYSGLVQRLSEVDTLRRLAAAREQADAIGLAHEINALCRGSVVLLSSHLEAYVKDLGEVALNALYSQSVSRIDVSPRLYYHLSQDLLSEVRDTAEPEKLAEKVFAFIDRDLSTWSKVGAFPAPLPTDRFNKGFANPAFRKIKKYFMRFGYEAYQRDLAAELRADYQPTVNMVDHLVDTRNKIAHGDPTALMTPSEVNDMILIIQGFCRATDGVFASWHKERFCAIR